MTMQGQKGPIVDDKNPLYCPTIPAATYLQALRSKISETDSRRYPSKGPVNSFARGFGRSFHASDRAAGADDDDDTVGSDWILGGYFSSGQGWFSSPSPASEDLPPYSPIAPMRSFRLSTSNFAFFPSRAPQRDELKRKNTFTDFGAPPKYARSIQSVHESSFDIEICHERLDFSQYSDSSPAPFALVAEHDAPSQFDDIPTLISQLETVFPGVRLKERLSAFTNHTSQELMDFLAENGYINARVLHIFRQTSVKCITFAPSLFDENGLNLPNDDIYTVFGKPENYRFLTQLSFSGIHIRHADLLYIHHLPNLSTLLLNETGIGNEGVFLLVSLKRTLTKLSLAMNPDINNDSVPAILILERLSFLSILDTGIDMAGLRCLAKHTQETGLAMDIEIPFACEAYVDDINSQYLLRPLPPLITNPGLCSSLSSTSLKRNLEAHAACNSSIIATGTRVEMIKRLSDILTIRRLDMLVMSMLEGDESLEASLRND